MVPHPYFKLKHGTHLLFFCSHVYGFCLFSAYISLNFHFHFIAFIFIKGLFNVFLIATMGEQLNMGDG